MKKILCILMFISFSVAAQIRPFIVINKNNVNGMFYEDINRVVSKEVISFNRFEILIRNEVEIKNKNIDVVELIVGLDKFQEKNKITVELMDANTQKTLGYLQEKMIPDQRLLYQARKMVQQLLRSQTIAEYLKEFKKKKDEATKKNKERDYSENKDSISEGMKEGRTTEAEDKNEMADNQDLKISKSGQSLNNKKKKNPKGNTKIANYIQSDITLDKTNEFSAATRGSPYKWASRYSLNAGLQQETISSVGLVETKNNINWMSFRSDIDFHPEKWKYTFFSGNIGVRKVVAKNEYSLPLSYNAGGGFTFSLMPIELHTRLQYEKSDFVNLYQPGAGLSVISSSVLWGEVGMSLKIFFREQDMTFDLRYGQALSASAEPSAYSRIDGRYFKISANTKIYKNFYASFEGQMKQLELSSDYILINNYYGACISLLWMGIVS